MANATVNFEVTPGDNITSYWIKAGGKTIELIDGKGSVSLKTGESHMLVWWMLGAAGSKISIVGKHRGTKVVEVKTARYPLTRHRVVAPRGLICHEESTWTQDTILSFSDSPCFCLFAIFRRHIKKPDVPNTKRAGWKLY